VFTTFDANARVAGLLNGLVFRISKSAVEQGNLASLDGVSLATHSPTVASGKPTAERACFAREAVGRNVALASLKRENLRASSSFVRAEHLLLAASAIVTNVRRLRGSVMRSCSPQKTEAPRHRWRRTSDAPSTLVDETTVEHIHRGYRMQAAFLRTDMPTGRLRGAAMGHRSRNDRAMGPALLGCVASPGRHAAKWKADTKKGRAGVPAKPPGTLCRQLRTESIMDAAHGASPESSLVTVVMYIWDLRQ
jgi:hypothetical protein